MVDIRLIPSEEFQRIRDADLNKYDMMSLIADLSRLNTLSIVKRAGSGHLGTSFSAMDIVTLLYYEQMNTLKSGFDSPDRDIYFSSKGHDVPGLYAVLFSIGILSQDRFLKLRRLGGLDGHPDVGIPGIEANSGSLGMGISKARGMAWAKRAKGKQGTVYVMTGDGELQEGQIYEALQTTVHHQMGNLVVIVDHNKVQSDKQVCEIIDLGNLEDKFQNFGWHVARCNGHDFQALEGVLKEFQTISDKPKILIADTIKGRGISFMEHPAALKAGDGLYAWHAGAPDDQAFTLGFDELKAGINNRLQQYGLAPLHLEKIETESEETHPILLLGEPVSQAAATRIKGKVSDEYVAAAYGKALVDIAPKRPDLVVLDADLSSDCKIREFELTYPDQFIENGIAEQDMVSMAGGLARQGLLPVVNSFASFLASRANEQIYNNASEKTKIIYACHYAGLIPAGPGKSHQSIRDVSLFGALPNMIIVQPGNAEETRLMVEYCIETADENCMIRLPIGPSPRIIALPDDYQFRKGCGSILTPGQDAVIFSYGPVMLHETLVASEILAEQGFGLQVVNLPWLNRVDANWLSETISGFRALFVLEDHAPVGGLGDHLLNVLNQIDKESNCRLINCAVEGYPVCGTPAEALQFHKMDGVSIAERILDYHML
jgi:transketolase